MATVIASVATPFVKFTMDYHGSYRSAVKNLKDAFRLHRKPFQAELAKNPRWLGEKMEGPNIDNVFKRTFYQMMLKFQIGADPECGGCVLALPQSVWDGWQRHLGRTELKPQADGPSSCPSPTAYLSPCQCGFTSSTSTFRRRSFQIRSRFAT